jgi:hypothetical protein
MNWLYNFQSATLFRLLFFFFSSPDLTFEKADIMSSCLPEPSVPSFNLLFFSLWCSLDVSIRWQGVHRVRKLSIPEPPPPSATAVMWSACQKSCSSGSCRKRSRLVEGSFQLAFSRVFSLSAGCNDFMRQNKACASILHS